MSKRAVECEERFFIAMMTLSLFLVGVIIFKLVQTVAGDEYLYNVMKPEDYFPVMEYVTPKGHDTDKTYVSPSFLTDKAAPNRVVEYYAPWCPHCQHFKEHYIDLARGCTKMGKAHGLDIEFHAVSCTANKRVCNEQGIRSYPSMLMYSAGNSTGTRVPYSTVHCFTFLKMFGVVGLDEEEAKNKEKVSSDAVALLPNHDGRTKKEIYHDAFLSFTFAMQQSIFMSLGPLTNHTSEVFGEWIDLLNSALPPSWKIHNVLDAILDDFDTVVQDELNLKKIVDKFGPASNTWHCEAGYTCGLWELFHIMTIGVVEWNLGATEISVITANDAADALHDYISEFFACDVCRRHFLQEYDACAHDRCTRLGSSTTDPSEWKQLALWLWEAHNAVNVRLMHEKADREKKTVGAGDELAAIWPSRGDCPLCWHVDGTWDDEVMYKYLRITYWIDDSHTLTYRKDLKLDGEKISMNNDLDENSRIESKSSSVKKLFGNDAVKRSGRPPQPSPMPVMAAAIIAGLAGLWYCYRKMERTRTGMHKKVDLTA